MKKPLTLLVVILLLPVVQGDENNQYIDLDVYYDDVIQLSGDIHIINKMNGVSLLLEDIDLSQPIDISNVDPAVGDYLKIMVTLDSTDSTMKRTICLIYTGNLIFRIIQLYSNQANLGDLNVDNSGENIDWDTQNIEVKMKSSTPPENPTVMFLARNEDAVFHVNYDQTEMWQPPCDEGFNWSITFTFELYLAANNQNLVAEEIISSGERVDGGFCTNPSPSEPAITDPELTIIIPAPNTMKSETYLARGRIYLLVNHFIASYDDNGVGDGWTVVDTRNEQKYGPDCEEETPCHHQVTINWI